MLTILNTHNNTSKGIPESDADTTLLDGPSSSGLTPLKCTLGTTAVGAVQCAKTIEINSENTGSLSDHINSPLTPGSTTSTAPLNSLPNSPLTEAAAATTQATSSSALITFSTTTDTMPAKTTTTAPVIISTTTTAEIIDDNRFSILSKDTSNDVDVYHLPSPPKDDLYARDNLTLNTLADLRTASNATTPSPSTSPKSDTNTNNNVAETPTKTKLHHRNHNNNNNQSDINSIESISDNAKIPSSNLEWIDEVLLERNTNEALSKTKKKKKKKISTTKELDQIDGLPIKGNNNEDPPAEEEKMVKCLYYTLMCCECTIS